MPLEEAGALPWQRKAASTNNSLPLSQRSCSLRCLTSAYMTRKSILNIFVGLIQSLPLATSTNAGVPGIFFHMNAEDLDRLCRPQAKPFGCRFNHGENRQDQPVPLANLHTFHFAKCCKVGILPKQLQQRAEFVAASWTLSRPLISTRQMQTK